VLLLLAVAKLVVKRTQGKFYIYKITTPIQSHGHALLLAQGQSSTRKRGMANLADYHTKHHPTSHHRNVRSTYVSNSVSSYPSKRHCKGVLKPSNRYKPLHRCTLKTVRQTVGRSTLISPVANQARHKRSINT